MEIYSISDINSFKINIKNLSLVLGFFDGVHIGHAQLISFARANTPKKSLGLLTFDHTLKNTNDVLLSNKDKVKEMEKLGVDFLFIIKADEKFKTMPYDKFVDALKNNFSPSKIFCGPDFRFGYNALGDVNYLKAKFGTIYIIDFIKTHNEVKISSSNIKELIRNGNIVEAARLLGRPYKICGKVVYGKQNGRKLGFNTANIETDIDYVMPKRGVYFTKPEVNGKIYPSITNVGVHPSISPLKNILIETHILDFNEDIYGQEIEVYFYEFERDEQNFALLDDLIKRINLDKANAKKYSS